eukprot:282738-Pleurochrysis_carterae.AAC.1
MRRRAHRPTQVAAGSPSQSLSACAGTVGTDTEDHDAEQQAKHLQKVRALHEKWDRKYDDLPLADRRRLHEQAQQRRGLLHGQLSDDSFQPGGEIVADTFAEVALDAYLPPHSTQK